MIDQKKMYVNSRQYTASVIFDMGFTSDKELCEEVWNVELLLCSMSSIGLCFYGNRPLPISFIVELSFGSAPLSDSWFVESFYIFRNLHAVPLGFS